MDGTTEINPDLIKDCVHCESKADTVLKAPMCWPCFDSYMYGDDSVEESVETFEVFCNNDE